MRRGVDPGISRPMTPVRQGSLRHDDGARKLAGLDPLPENRWETSHHTPTHT